MRRTLLGIAVILIMVGVPAAATAGVPTERIVYSDAYGGSGLYTALPDASGRTPVPNTRRALGSEWSPDGSGIAFLARGGGIRWVDADGSNGHALVTQASLPDGWPYVWGFSWSPDGTQLVVDVQARDYSHDRLVVATVADGSLTPLLRGAFQPDWASNGQIVAARAHGLVTLDADGSNLVLLPISGGVTQPAWSPDESQIAFLRNVNKPEEGTSYDVFVVDADGSNRTNLTRSPQVDWSPTWSPDGSMIMWSRSKVFFGYADLFTMLADGSNVTRLTHTDKIDEFGPDWTA